MCPQCGLDQIAGIFIHVRHTRIDPIRQYAFGQVVNFLKTLTRIDHEFSLHEQLFKRLLGGLPVPPSRVTPTGILEVPGAQRALGSNACPNFAHQILIAVLEPATLAVHLCHARQGKTIISHWQPGRSMKPVFEDFALSYQLIEEPGRVIRDPGPQHMVVGAFDHGNGIDLHITQLLDSAQRRPLAAAERISSQQALLIECDASEFWC